MEKENRYENGSWNEVTIIDHSIKKQCIIWAVILAGIMVLTVVHLVRNKKVAGIYPSGALTKAEVDYPPGERKATVETSGGTTIKVGAVNKRSYQVSPGITLLEDNGTIRFAVRKKQNGAKLQQLIVPIGGEYVLDMGNGIKVWLNAGSRLTFLIRYPSDQIFVFLKGEAHFQLKWPSKKTLIVMTNGLHIQANCPTFAVDAYLSQYTRVYASQGSVNIGQFQSEIDRIRIQKDTTVLSPSGFFSFVDVKFCEDDLFFNAENGRFTFNNISLRQIADKLSRWYNVSFECPPEPGGLINLDLNTSRKHTLKGLLNILEGLGVARFIIYPGRWVQVEPIK